MEVAKALTKRDADGNIIRSGFQPRYLGGGEGVSGKVMAWFHNNGGKVIADDFSTSQGYVNSADSKEAMKWFQTLVQETANLEFGAPETAFQSGQAAIINREAWFADDTIQKAPNINFVCAPFPAGKIDMAPDTGTSNWSNMVINRKYVAVVEGIMENQEGVVKSYLAENSQFEVYSTDNPEKGQLAITRYKTITTGNGYSLVEYELDTGRKNQIRVHSKDMGHPIVGDRKYGAKTSPIHRLALHAMTLRFVHPITRKEMNFSTPIPTNFAKLTHYKTSGKNIDAPTAANDID